MDSAVRQHRLWRFGPNFDPKTKGGIWHKDTCPFGINGANPEGSLMFTTVCRLSGAYEQGKGRFACIGAKVQKARSRMDQRRSK